MEKIIIKVTDKCSDFESLRDEWRQLSEKSDVSPLFLSWEWQYSWWKTWSNRLSLTLFLLKAYKGDELVGIAPLYIDNVRIFRGVRASRLQFIGNAWRQANTVRTEYLEFITKADISTAVCETFLKFIGDSYIWDEFLICDIVKDSDTYNAINNKDITGHWHVLKRDFDFGVKINTQGAFPSYLSSLGKGTRLKLFNRRNMIEKIGDFKVKGVKQSEIDPFFTHLNEFHQERWGQHCFNNEGLEFHNRFLTSITNEGNLKLSFLELDGRIISVLYNIKMGRTVFNLQSGFIEDFNKKISLGTLHLGFSIEDAFNECSTDNFDLLAGEGKNSFYKENFKGEEVEFLTMQLVRKKRLKYLYKLFFVLPKNYRDFISKRLAPR